ncbi:MAG: GAF domain-containing protein [Deltaproteobacteria bacterium]|nr:MAG: GAF domain-containing protein [Deltaproteobacteria bacterium]
MVLDGAARHRSAAPVRAGGHGAGSRGDDRSTCRRSRRRQEGSGNGASEEPMTGEELARSAARPAPRAGMLATLLEIGQTLASPVELRTALERVLGTLERDAGVRRAAVLMLDSGSEEIRVAVSVGLAAEAHRVRCRLGQGIAGRVVESGRPVAMAVPSREPLFPRGAGEESALEGSFYCVPIAAERRPLGALAIEVRQDDQADGGDGGHFFALIATMISRGRRRPSSR